MAEMGLLQAAGAPQYKPTKNAPLTVKLMFTGLFTQRNPMLMPGTRVDKFYGGRPDALIDGLNTEVSSRNTLIRRPGFSQYTSGTFSNGVTSFYSFRKSNTQIYMMADAPDGVYSVNPSSITKLFTKETTNQTFFQSIGPWVFMGDGTTSKKWDGTTTYNWGIVAPATAPLLSFELGSASTYAVTGWSYGYCFRNSKTKHISTMSPVSGNTGPKLDFYAGIEGDGSPDPQVDEVQIYRTTDGGATYCYLATVENPGAGQTWVYQDSEPDTSLNQYLVAPQALANEPPPTGITNMTFFAGRMWGSVDNYVYYAAGPDCTNGSGNEAWPPLNYFQFPSRVVRMIAYPNGLFVFTTDDIYVIQGNVSATGAQLVGGSPFYSILFQAGIGVLNYNALDMFGSMIYVFTSDKRVLVINPGAGVIDLGFPIGDQFANIDPSKASVAFHADGYHDQALFVCDGNGHMWRCNPTQMPEGSPCWSPKATVTGGASLVDSIEVVPGTFKLFVASGNKILCRDWSTFSDCGTAYDAFATFGSIVLAIAGQLADVESISTEAMAVGVLPAVSVLLSEISGGFKTLPVSQPDPPQLEPSKTVYSSRFYLNQAEVPTIMRHMQLKVAFAKEAQPNELLSFSIYGSVENE